MRTNLNRIIPVTVNIIDPLDAEYQYHGVGTLLHGVKGADSAKSGEKKINRYSIPGKNYRIDGFSLADSRTAKFQTCKQN